MMSETTERPICHRADDMVASLYGEATPAEAEDFASHLNLCAACRTEFTLLSQVHESVLHWRAEVLGAEWQAGSVSEASLPPVVIREPRQRLSAWAAVREFFAISPVWLRGATAMASVLFLLFVGLFLARMVKTPEKLYTRQDLDAQVQERVEQAKKEIVQQQPESSTLASKEDELPLAPVAVEDDGFQKVSDKPGSMKGSSRRLLSRSEREQLAAELRLKPGADEDDVSFLLDDGSD